MFAMVLATIHNTTLDIKLSILGTDTKCPGLETDFVIFLPL